MNQPKVLVFDIETSPIEAFVWDLKDQNISLNQIKRDSAIMSWAAKWLNAPASQVMYQDQRKKKDIKNDKQLLQGIWKLLDEADIVITQYGTGFDSPRLNARFITHGMKPPSPYKHLDTYQIASRVAKFTSNKLEYLTDKLCTKYKKLKHDKYPGQSLWTACLNGDIKAWDEMKRYNIHDVLATEELYLKLRAWVPASAPSVYQSRGACTVCGNKSLQRNGQHRKKTGIYQRLHCLSCGKWSIGEKMKESNRGD